MSKSTLAVLIRPQIGDEEVHVEIEVPIIQQAAAGEPEVHTVVERFVAAIRPAVVVHHRRHALVDILGGEEEPVVMEPEGAL